MYAKVMLVSSICFLNLKILTSFKPKKFDSFLKFTYMDNVTKDNCLKPCNTKNGKKNVKNVYWLISQVNVFSLWS